MKQAGTNFFKWHTVAIHGLAILIILQLSGCGFHLRGQLANNESGSSFFAFKSLWLDAPALFTPADMLRQNLQSTITISSQSEDAQVHLRLIGETQSKKVLSVDPNGRIREYRLDYQLHYQITSPPIVPAVILQRRDLSYDDTQVLAKEAEEKILWQAMQEDAVNQIVRSLSKLQIP